MILMFAIIYFLLIRPQMKRQKKQQSMLSELKKGDQVLTRGGIFGKITTFKGKDDNKVIVDIGKDMKITVSRQYVVGKVSESGEAPPDK